MYKLCPGVEVETGQCDKHADIYRKGGKPKEDIRTSATLEDGKRWAMNRALVRFRLRDVLMPPSWVLRSTS